MAVLLVMLLLYFVAMSTTNIQELVTVINTATSSLDLAPAESLASALDEVDPSEVQTELGLVMDRVRAIIGALPGVCDLARQTHVGAMQADHAYYDIFNGDTNTNPVLGGLMDAAQAANLKSATTEHDIDVMSKKFGEAFSLLVGASTLIAESVNAYDSAALSAESASVHKTAALEAASAYTASIKE